MSALREELQSLRLMQLYARAEAAGVATELLDDAMDGAQPRAAMIELLLRRQERGAAQKCAPQPEPEPEASGGGTSALRVGTGAAARIIAGFQGDKAQREAAYVQLEALARGDSSGIGSASASGGGGEREALVDVAAECIGPLMETVFAADVSVVDAAEFRRAQLVLCELCLLDPLRLLAEYLRDLRIGLSWGTPGNAWAAVFDKEPSELTREDALTVAAPCTTLSIVQARGESVRPALPRPADCRDCKAISFCQGFKTP